MAAFHMLIRKFFVYCLIHKYHMYVTMVLQMSFEDAFGVHHEERGSHAQVDVQRPLQCMNISIGMFFTASRKVIYSDDDIIVFPSREQYGVRVKFTHTEPCPVRDVAWRVSIMIDSACVGYSQILTEPNEDGFWCATFEGIRANATNTLRTPLVSNEDGKIDCIIERGHLNTTVDQSKYRAPADDGWMPDDEEESANTFSSRGFPEKPPLFVEHFKSYHKSTTYSQA